MYSRIKLTLDDLREMDTCYFVVIVHCDVHALWAIVHCNEAIALQYAERLW